MTPYRQRVLVAGGGQVGLELTETLVAQGHQVIIIERDPDRCETLNDRYVASVIEGDATDPEVLTQAQPSNADAIVAVTDSPPTNLLVCRIAREFGIPMALAIDDGTLGNAKIDGVAIIEHTKATESLVNAVLDQISE